MTAISKELFYNKIDERIKCSTIHYWSNDCWKAIITPEYVKACIKGSANFYLPIYLLKLLMNYKNIKNKQFILDLFVSEMRSIVFAFSMTSLYLSGTCILRAICGRLHYYTVFMFPGLISGLTLLIESEENQTMNTLTFFNALVETVLNKAKISISLQTIMFMTISAFLMVNFENKESKLRSFYLWFYTPSKTNNESSDYKCDHYVTCSDFTWRGFRKYFTVGYGLNFARTFLLNSQYMFKKPAVILDMLFNLDNCKLGFFVGSYVGLYRAITCYFTKTTNIRPNKSSCVAGLVAGATYMAYPKRQFLVVAITTMLQIIYDYISQKLKITNHFWQRLLLFIFCHGYLLHNKFMFADTCSPYYNSLVNANTNGITNLLYKNLISTMAG